MKLKIYDKGEKMKKFKREKENKDKKLGIYFC